METGSADQLPQAARRRGAQPRARAGSRQGRVQRRRAGCEPGGGGARRPASASARSIVTSRRARRSFEAVYRREVEQLSELAEQLKGEAAPVEALRRWLRSNVEFVATKKGMASRACARRRPSLPRSLTAFSYRAADQSDRHPARTRGRGRRNPRRHHARGSAADTGRHVHAARPARLASGRCQDARRAGGWAPRAVGYRQAAAFAEKLTFRISPIWRGP